MAGCEEGPEGLNPNAVGERPFCHGTPDAHGGIDEVNARPINQLLPPAPPVID